jgi:hypothetical protein
MRVLFTLFVVTVISATSAIAQNWQLFGVRQGGFVFDVPPEFTLEETAKNGMGASFRKQDEATLTVWGDKLPANEFEGTITAQANKDEATGWNVSYRRITPTWASYSGVKGGLIRYFRAIQICEDRVAIFQLDYDKASKTAYDRVVTRMVKSLKVEGC